MKQPILPEQRVAKKLGIPQEKAKAILAKALKHVKRKGR